MINTMMAGAGGALGALLFRSMMVSIIRKIDEEYMNSMTFDQPWKRINYQTMKNKTSWINVYPETDCFLVERGLIAGMVSVSLDPSAYEGYTALINGMIAGALYVFSLKVFKNLKLDDTIHSSSVHGISGLYALLAICFFHKEKGFFYNDTIFTENKDQSIQPILLVGSTALATFTVVIGSIFLVYITFRIVMAKIMRVSKVQEIVGQDTYHLFTIGDRILRNYLQGIINSYYPEPNGDYGLKKQRIIAGVGLAHANATKIRKNAKHNFLSIEQLKQMRDIVQAEIAKRKIENEEGSNNTTEIFKIDQSYKFSAVSRIEDQYKQKMDKLKQTQQLPEPMFN